MILGLSIAVLTGVFLALLSLWIFKKIMVRYRSRKIASLKKTFQQTAQFERNDNETKQEVEEAYTETKEWVKNRVSVASTGLKFFHSYLSIYGGLSLGLLGFTTVPMLFHFYIVNIDPNFKLDPMMPIWQGRMQWTVLFSFLSLGILLSGLQNRIRRSLEQEIENTKLAYEQKISELELLYEKSITEPSNVTPKINAFPRNVSNTSDEMISTQEKSPESKRKKLSSKLLKGLLNLALKNKA